MTIRGQPTTPAEQRLMYDLTQQGLSDPAIATRVHRSVWTVRTWRRRLQRTPLFTPPKRGRPRYGPLATFDSALVAHIRQLRHDHPGWGATVIRAELLRDPHWQSVAIPSRARIGDFLHHHGLTRHYQAHTTLPQAPKQEHPPPHDTWQVDAAGTTHVAGLGKVSLINIVDVGSRLKVESMPSSSCNPPCAAYQLALRRAFLQHGLPTHISFDHGTVFFDNTSPSPFPTRLHVWLIALGIQVQFIRVRRPTDHGIVERTHQTLAAQALVGQTWVDLVALWQGLDDRRSVLNTLPPTRTPTLASPTERVSDHALPPRLYRPEWEAELLDITRIGTYVQSAYWIRRGSPNGAIGLGGHKYWIGPAVANQTVHITFDVEQWQFRLHPVGADAVWLTPRGLSAATLMGPDAEYLRFPTYQLALPCSADLWRTTQYAILGMDAPPVAAV